MIPMEWLQAASARIAGSIKQTPLTYDSELNVFLKWENRQVTGSFKVRGALNKILSLEPWEAKNGLVTCSAGNHGQGVALAAQKIGTTCIVFVSSHAVPTKVSAMQALGADIRFVTGGYADAEKTAILFALDSKGMFISPYNDVQVIAGQGTVGLELIEQTQGFREIKTLLVPIGGGGLLSGIGAAISGLTNRPKLIGVQSEASAYFNSLYNKGTQDGVIEKESLADGLSGEVDHGSITIPMVNHYADDIVLVTEQAISQSIAYAWRKYKEVIEGSAAVTLAAILTKKIAEMPAVLVISGGNIQPDSHEQILAQTSIKEREF
ncbi:MAG: serine/threonine dehydratase [Anaerolinea sp.]|nr:serine/threonine dehydratase [Anaerolinea sp.]